MQDSKSSNPNNLTQEESQLRKSQVSDVSYNLTLVLTAGSPTYEGHFIATFKRNNSQGKALFFDFVGKTIHSLTINGEELKGDDVFSGNRVHINKAPEGDVKVEIKYTNEYNHGGEGFHQFIDPEDKNEYLYTNFEPFDCHRWLPCFDQPNIKAALTLTVTAPSVWKVIANSIGRKEEKGDSTVHHFEPTPRISTYLFALVAGPYDEINDNYDNRVPLGLFVRKSLRKYFDDQVLFIQTKQGMKFYEEFFDVKYPFSKYDQIFVPELNVGAMENVGCVTFTEHYVFKDPPTRSQKANRADTVLHEMAHMWFGNLVSPEWWDGLWLNESFATYMAALCTAKATEYEELSWLNFNSGMKEWAYREDQLSTTHSIQGVVPDTEATFLNFDGITYGKGASLLKQLVYFVGLDSFKEGLRYYFKKHAWGNTTIEQFLEAIEHGSKGSFSAKDWSKEWLETSGLNTLLLEINSSNGKVEKALVTQTAPEEHPTLRTHHAEVVLFDLDGSDLKKRESFKLIVSGKETSVNHLIGQNTPSFIFINFNDHAYAKCLLDPVSLQFVSNHMDKITDPLLKQLLWSALYALTRDAKMKSTDFLDLVCNSIHKETDPKLISTILRRALNSISFVPDSLYFKSADKLFDAIYPQVAGAKDDFKIIWARNATASAVTKEKVGILLEALKAGNEALDQVMRWNILEKAASWDMPGVAELLEKEGERDKSDEGQRGIATAKSSYPKAEVKEAAWARFLDKDTKVSAHQLAADMQGFRWHHQKDLTTPYNEKFFSVVRNIFNERPREVANSFFQILFPDEPEDNKIFEAVENLLKTLANESEDKHLRRCLKEQLDDLKRSLKCRQLVGL